MKRFAVLLALLASASGANAQSVQQSGKVTPEHVPVWATNGVIKDGGTAANPLATSFGVVGGQNCANSAPITSPYNALCFQALPTGGVISLNNFGGAMGGLSFKINGTSYQFPYTVGGIVGPVSTTVGHLATWNNITGSLLADGQALSQAVTGNWTFNPTSGDALTINPLSGTAGKGFNITQTGANTGAASAPVHYNSIVVTDGSAVNSGSLESTPLYIEHILSSASEGQKYGLFVTSFHQQATSGMGDQIAGTLFTQSSASAGGTNTGGGAFGTVIGGNSIADLEIGGTNYYIVAAHEFDAVIATGASAANRLGVHIAGAGNLKGATLDAAVSITSSGTSWNSVINLNGLSGGAPLSTVASIINGDGTNRTITNGINLPEYTITGNIFNFANFQVTGAGAVNAVGVYSQNGTAGVNCSGAPSGSFASSGGIVTHC